MLLLEMKYENKTKKQNKYVYDKKIVVKQTKKKTILQCHIISKEQKRMKKNE